MQKQEECWKTHLKHRENAEQRILDLIKEMSYYQSQDPIRAKRFEFFTDLAIYHLSQIEN